MKKLYNSVGISSCYLKLTKWNIITNQGYDLIAIFEVFLYGAISPNRDYVLVTRVFHNVKKLRLVLMIAAAQAKVNNQN